jgi:hypothetical protein
VPRCATRLQSRDVADCNLECPEAPRDTTSCSSSSCGTAPVRRPGASRSRGTRLACTCDEGAIRRSSEANQEAHFRRQARTQSRMQSRMQLGKHGACGARLVAVPARLMQVITHAITHAITQAIGLVAVPARLMQVREGARPRRRRHLLPGARRLPNTNGQGPLPRG